MATTKLTPEQLEQWRAYLGGSRALMERLDREMRDRHRLSFPEHEVLVRLSRGEDRRMRMAELAAAASVSRSRLTHTVERLEKAGFVEREACDSDGRGIVAVLTTAGLDALRVASHTHLGGIHGHFVSQITPEEFATIAAVMERIVEKLGGTRF